MFDSEDLFGLVLEPRTLEGLEEFLCSWDTVLTFTVQSIPEHILLTVFLKQVRKVDALTLDITLFDRLRERSKKKTYTRLRDTIDGILVKRHLQDNRKQTLAAYNQGGKSSKVTALVGDS